MRHRGVRGFAALCSTGAILSLILAGCAAPAGGSQHPDVGEPVAVAQTLAPTATPKATPTATPTVTPVVTPTPTPPPPPAPVDPLRPACDGEREMSVWAHADDDLLFVGTQMPRVLASGGCVRTVFLTDGDAGRGPEYALGRVRGIQRAYDVLRGASSEWTETSVSLPSGLTVSVHQPLDDARVSLVFLHLPDGNLSGQGYPVTGEVSLAKLAAGKITVLPQTTGAGAVSWGAIVAGIDDLITGYVPTSLLTHVPGSANTLAKGDHTDHAITGILARKAWYMSERGGAAITYAMGYQSSQRPSNLDGERLSRKIAAFRTYAEDDPVVRGCHDDVSCLAVRPFGAWLSREYLFTEGDLGLG